MDSRVTEIFFLISNTLLTLGIGSNCDAFGNPSDPFVNRFSKEDPAQATTSFCLRGAKDCLVVKLCNTTVKLFNSNVSASTALCAERDEYYGEVYEENEISFERSKIEEPHNGTCDCTSCGKFCFPQNEKTTYKSATHIKSREITNTTIRRQFHQTDNDDDGDYEKEELPDIPLSHLFFDVGLRASSCLSQSPGYNYTIIKACNIELLGIFSESELPTLCYGGYANVTSVLSLSDPHSALILHLNPIKRYPHTDNECSCNLCDEFC